jgi:hypothetical protein
MLKLELPIPLHQLALLQAYLYEIFGGEKNCEKNFKYTKWYLSGNFSDLEIEEIMKYFDLHSLSCDCDILNKLDLREIVDGRMKFHN